MHELKHGLKHGFSERSMHGGVDQIPLPGIHGGLWLCGKHAIGPDPEALLAQVGATTVICLNEEPELVDRYPSYVQWLRREPERRAVWFPIPDLHAPSPEVAVPFINDLTDRLTSGEVLLMHCGAGIGRAGTMAMGVLMAMGATPGEALDTVRQHRPMAGPEAGAQRDLIEALALLSPFG